MEIKEEGEREEEIVKKLKRKKVVTEDGTTK